MYAADVVMSYEIFNAVGRGLIHAIRIKINVLVHTISAKVCDLSLAWRAAVAIKRERESWLKRK